MDRWRGKTAVVTGASAGIGAAVSVALAKVGLLVIGLARRPHLVDKLCSQVTGEGSIRSRQCDVSRLEDVTATFAWVDDQLGGADLLVNNAGVMFPGQITDFGPRPLTDAEITTIMNTNVMGMIHCTRHAIASMKRRKVDGHIININSIAGHYIPFSQEFNIYSSSKHAVTAFTASLLNELSMLKSNVKVTSVSPGLVATDMTVGGVDLVDFKPLQPKDVADAVLYALSTPPNVNITELTIQPVQEKRL